MHPLGSAVLDRSRERGQTKLDPIVLQLAAGAVAFVVTVVLANDETACLGVVVVLVGVGLCAVETAGLAVNFDGAEGMLDGATLEGLGGTTVAAGG